MTIDLSTITFTNQADVVPVSGEEYIVNTGIANTLDGNDTITGSGLSYNPFTPSSGYGIFNSGTLNTGEGNDIITGTGRYDFYNSSPASGYGIYNIGTLNTAEDNDIITGTGERGGIYNTGTLNTAEGNDTISARGGTTGYGIYNTEIG